MPNFPPPSPTCTLDMVFFRSLFFFFHTLCIGPNLTCLIIKQNEINTLFASHYLCIALPARSLSELTLSLSLSLLSWETVELQQHKLTQAITLLTHIKNFSFILSARRYLQTVSYFNALPCHRGILAELK